jgi:hypothetical protein
MGGSSTQVFGRERVWQTGIEYVLIASAVIIVLVALADWWTRALRFALETKGLCFPIVQANSVRALRRGGTKSSARTAQKTTEHKIVPCGRKPAASITGTGNRQRKLVRGPANRKIAA